MAGVPGQQGGLRGLTCMQGGRRALLLLPEGLASVLGIQKLNGFF